MKHNNDCESEAVLARELHEVYYDIKLVDGQLKMIIKDFHCLPKVFREKLVKRAAENPQCSDLFFIYFSAVIYAYVYKACNKNVFYQAGDMPLEELLQEFECWRQWGFPVPCWVIQQAYKIAKDSPEVLRLLNKYTLLPEKSSL